MNDLPSFAAEVIRASRVLKITTPLGNDTLLPEQTRIAEGVNQFFRIDISVRSKQDIAPADLTGRSTAS